MLSTAHGSIIVGGSGVGIEWGIGVVGYVGIDG